MRVYVFAFAYLRVLGEVSEAAPFFIARKNGSAPAVFLHLSDDFLSAA